MRLFRQEMERLCLRGCSRVGDLQDLMIKKTGTRTRLEPWCGRWFSTGRQGERVRPRGWQGDEGSVSATRHLKALQTEYPPGRGRRGWNSVGKYELVK